MLIVVPQSKAQGRTEAEFAIAPSPVAAAIQKPHDRIFDFGSYRAREDPIVAQVGESAYHFKVCPPMFAKSLAHQLSTLRRFEPIHDVGKDLDRFLIGLP